MRQITLMLLAGLLIAALPLSSSGNNDDEAIFQEYTSHMAQVYYTKMSMQAGLSNFDAVIKWNEDVKNNAAVYGYALYALKHHSNNWTEEQDRLFLMLKTRCEMDLIDFCKDIATKKGWDILQQNVYEAEVRFTFNGTFSGRRSQEMIELTGIRPEEAPDFLARFVNKPYVDVDPNANRTDTEQTDIVRVGTYHDGDLILGTWKQTGRSLVDFSVYVQKAEIVDMKQTYVGYLSHLDDGMKNNGYSDGDIYCKIIFDRIDERKNEITYLISLYTYGNWPASKVKSWGTYETITLNISNNTWKTTYGSPFIRRQ